MDTRTRTALLGSIEKWKKIVDGTGEDQAGDNCPLCTEFGNFCGMDKYGRNWEGCFGCPVAEHTGHWNCSGTPYQKEWRGAMEEELLRNPNYRFPYRATTDALRAAARKELEFLQSLLTQGEGEEGE